MKKQLEIFFTALMFFTRLPVPKNIGHSTAMLQKSARYFSWVGLLVGAIVAAALYGLQFIFSPALAILFSMIISIFVTGAFHEDGFADVCDGFGGGWTKDKILLIMKDSRLGTYGVIGVVAMLALKFLLLMELMAKSQNLYQFLIIILAAHALSRLAAVTIMQQYEYVADVDTSKSKPLADRKLTLPELLTAIAGAALPLLFLNYTFLCALVPVLIARLYLGNYFNKWIGGYTGDCLGATQQVSEVFFYLGCVGVLQWL